MKRTIRQNVFETNSSSTHSITMCTKTDFENWTTNEDLFMGNDGDVKTFEELLELAKVHNRFNMDRIEDKLYVTEFFDDYLNGYKTRSRFNDYYGDMEDFVAEYTTPNGETVVAFGYYGNDY